MDLKLLSNVELVNAHMHLININHVGKNLIPLIVRMAKNKNTRKFLINVLRAVDPLSKTDDIERLANFVESMGKTQRDKMNEIMTQYPKGTLFASLTIDHTYVGAGKPSVSYEEQIEGVVNLIKIGYPIHMYLHIDARRPDYFELIKKYKKYITGIKMYNLMGYFPYDIRLSPLYNWCSDNGKPIIFHCSPENINYYRGDDIDRILNNSHYPLTKGKNNREKSSNFNNPLGIIEVAKEYGEVNMMISHLCGIEEVRKYIVGEKSWTTIGIQGCLENKNVFLDTSFVACEPAIYKLIDLLLETPIIEDKLCYGDDFDPNKSVAFQENYYPGLKNNLTPEKWKKHSLTNYKNFLKL